MRTGVRPSRTEDQTFFRSLAQDARVTRFVGDGQPWSDAAVRERVARALTGDPWTARGGHSLFIVTDRGQRIGILSLTDRGGDVEVGYWVHPDHWGVGHATRLIRQVPAMVSEARGPTTLRAHVHEDNLASRHVLEVAGFDRVPGTRGEDGLLVYRMGTS